MPTSREVVSQKPIVGSDLAEIIKADVAAILANDCFYTPFIAFHRVAYEVRITLHMDNPVAPKSISVAKSRPIAADRVEANPALAAIESLPLTPPPPAATSSVDSQSRSRDIPSPNAARVAFGIPIDVTVRDNDGRSQERSILYPSDYPGAVTPEPTDSDTTAETRAELGLPPEDAVPVEEVPQP